MITCPDCGMAFLETSADELRQHRTHHDRVVNGLRAPPLSSDETVWSAPPDRIVVVTSHSPKAQRKRAATVAQLANIEAHHAGGIYDGTGQIDERDEHVFLYSRRGRMVALALFEKRHHVWRCTWEEYTKGTCAGPASSPIWSLGFIWVLKRIRGSGLGRTLFNQAVAHLQTTTDRVGLYTPFTESGEAFVRSVYPQEFLIAK